MHVILPSRIELWIFSGKQWGLHTSRDHIHNLGPKLGKYNYFHPPKQFNLVKTLIQMFSIRLINILKYRSIQEEDHITCIHQRINVGCHSMIFNSKIFDMAVRPIHLLLHQSFMIIAPFFGWSPFPRKTVRVEWLSMVLLIFVQGVWIFVIESSGLSHLMTSIFSKKIYDYC